MTLINAFGIEAVWFSKDWNEKQHPRDLYGMFTHSQVGLKAPWGQRVKVDREIAPVIQQLWDKGIGTYFSCQGSPRMARKFEEIRDNDELHGPGLAYIYMVDNKRWSDLAGHWSVNKHEYSPEQQELISRIENSNVTVETLSEDGDSWLPAKELHRSDSSWITELMPNDPKGPTVIVRFPHEDLPKLQQLLESTD